jgi:hypothetical protein
MIGHFAFLRDGKIMVISRSDFRNRLDYDAPQTKLEGPMVLLGRIGEKALNPITLTDSSSTIPPGQFFSIITDERKEKAILSGTDCNSMFLIDTSKNNFIERLSFPSPWGIAKLEDNRGYIVNGDYAVGNDNFKSQTEFPFKQKTPTKNLFFSHSLLV